MRSYNVDPERQSNGVVPKVKSINVEAKYMGESDMSQNTASALAILVFGKNQVFKLVVTLPIKH